MTSSQIYFNSEPDSAWKINAVSNESIPLFVRFYRFLFFSTSRHPSVEALIVLIPEGCDASVCHKSKLKKPGGTREGVGGVVPSKLQYPVIPPYSPCAHMWGTIQSDERRRGMPNDNWVSMDIPIPFPTLPPFLLSPPLTVSTIHHHPHKAGKFSCCQLLRASRLISHFLECEVAIMSAALPPPPSLRLPCSASTLFPRGPLLLL